MASVPSSLVARQVSAWLPPAFSGGAFWVCVGACNVVIRFDVFKNVKSHVQGTAEPCNSIDREA